MLRITIITEKKVTFSFLRKLIFSFIPSQNPHNLQIRHSQLKSTFLEENSTHNHKDNYTYERNKSYLNFQFQNQRCF